jgi:hypothetical protein
MGFMAAIHHAVILVSSEQASITELGQSFHSVNIAEEARYILDHQLRWGYTADKNAYLEIRRTFITPNRSIEADLEELLTSLKPRYMCNWAYNLLRTDRSSVPMDFRRFRQRFSNLFGERDSRCFPDGRLCDGSSPQSCQRHAGANVKGINQSAHDESCKGDCPKLS